jgi:hypothetical protein
VASTTKRDDLRPVFSFHEAQAHLGGKHRAILSPASRLAIITPEAGLP